MPLYGSEVDFDQIPVKNFIPESGTTPPVDPAEGQMWWDETAKEIKVFKDGGWVVTGYTSIVAEVETMLSDQADTIQGDIDAINGSISVLDGDIDAALTAAQQAQAVADGAIRTYYDAEPPWANGTTQPSTVLGDLWYDSDNDQAHRWNGSVWQIIEDNGIAAALLAAQNAADAATTAQESADGKNTVWYSPTAPGGSAHRVGDTWFDTDAGHKIYQWDGDSWEAALLGTNAIANLSITNALIADGTIQNAKIGTLDAGKITTGQLDADRIAASSITAKHLTIGSIGQNKIPNGSFEDGLDAWTPLGPAFGTVEAVSTNGPGGSGSYVLRMAHNSTPGNVSIITESSMYVPVTQDGSKPLWYSCRARADSAIASGFWFRATWYNAAKVQISNTTPYSNGALTTAFQTLEFQLIPPEGAAFLRVTIINSAVNSTVYVDDVMLREIVGTVQLADDGITAAKLKADAITAKHTITGPLFQTNAAANRGVKIVSADNSSYGQLVTYDAAGNPTFVLNGQTGAVTMKGELTSGSVIQGASISGGSVTGATLQTSATGQRITIADDEFYSMVKFHSGDPTEVAPGMIYSSAIDGHPSIAIDGPSTTDRPDAAYISMRPSAGTLTADGYGRSVVQVNEILEADFLKVNSPRPKRLSLSNQSLAHATWTTLNLNAGDTAFTVPYTTGGGWKNLAGTALVRIEAQVRFDGNPTGRRGVRICRNGTPMATVVNASSGGTVMDQNISTEFMLGYDQSVTIEVAQFSGGALDVVGNLGGDLTWGTFRIITF